MSMEFAEETRKQKAAIAAFDHTPKATDSERHTFPISRGKYCSITIFTQNLSLKFRKRQGTLALPKLIGSANVNKF